MGAILCGSKGFPKGERRTRRSAGEQFFDGRGERLGRGGRSVAGDHAALTIDKEFCEIPANGAPAEEAERTGLAAAEKAEEWMSAGAVDLDFGKEEKADGEIFPAEGADLLGEAGSCAPN